MVFSPEQVSNGSAEEYDNRTSLSGKLCGDDPPMMQTCKHTDMTVLMHSDHSVQDTGFRVYYETTFLADTGQRDTAAINSRKFEFCLSEVAFVRMKIGYL